VLVAVAVAVSDVMASAGAAAKQAANMECAGRAQRRRRFGFDPPAVPARQSGVALRLPPHSIAAGLL